MRVDRRTIIKFLVGIVLGVGFSYFSVCFIYPWLEKLDDIQRFMLLITLLFVYLVVLRSGLKKEKKLKEVL